ncbi:hypothetical protein MnTg02_01239 [bacterium MnTg02]|nr:hypothetical protein MnTg02_01239 [bacterium MnTg02]
MLDLFQPAFRAPDKHNFSMVKPFAQHLPESENIRNPAKTQNIHIQADARFEFGELEKRFHQNAWINRPALWFKNDADLFRRLVANILKQRDFL